MPSQKSPPLRRRWFRWYHALVVLLATIALTVGWILRSTQQAPPVYQELKAKTAEVIQQDIQHFDQKVDQLNQSRDRDGVHTIRFTQDEINAWLTESLPRRFPGSLPREVKELLIKLQPEDSSLIMKIESNYFSGFATATLDAGVGQRANLLEVQLKKIRSGVIRVPVGRMRKQIVAGANRSGIPLNWDQDHLPAQLTIDLDPVLNKQLAQPASILAVRPLEGAIEIDYQFSPSS